MNLHLRRAWAHPAEQTILSVMAGIDFENQARAIMEDVRRGGMPRRPEPRQNRLVSWILGTTVAVVLIMAYGGLVIGLVQISVAIN